MADVLGRALLDHHHGDGTADCRLRDGDVGRAIDLGADFFEPVEEGPDDVLPLLESLEGPVVDVGCGAGKYALWLQERHEVVGVDVSPGAVEVCRDRGVEDARVADMFDVTFPRDRFRTALVNGTQIGLAGSIAGVREFLCDLARITDPEGTAVVDSYDPTDLDDEFLGYRSDPRAGVARRTFHFEYERADGERLVGRTLCFVLLAPDRLRDATVGTPWSVAEVRPRGSYYKAVLEK